MKNMMQRIALVDSRIKMLLLVAIAYVGVAFGFNHVEAMTEIENYTPAINIAIKDGDQEAVGHLVKQSTVQDILSELEITLGEEDFLNVDGNMLLEDNQLVEINRVHYGEVKEEVEVAYNIVATGEVVSNASVEIVQNGENGIVENTFRVRYQNNQEVERTLINETVIKEAVEQIEEYTAPEASSSFTGRLTTYGGDCNGCSGRTATGVTVDANGANGSGSAQVYYNGGWYYVLAADRSIPFGTIIEISNHNLNLPSVIYGVVLDRGGDINGGNIDIFYGSEKGAKFFTGGTSYNTQFRIVG